MPWALAFATGCMIYMIPVITSEGHDNYGV